MIAIEKLYRRQYSVVAIIRLRLKIEDTSIRMNTNAEIPAFARFSKILLIEINLAVEQVRPYGF
jgi:hypothetical protein